MATYIERPESTRDVSAGATHDYSEHRGYRDALQTWAPALVDGWLDADDAGDDVVDIVVIEVGFYRVAFYTVFT